MSRPLSNPPFIHFRDPEEEAALNEAARLIGVEPWMLFAIMWSESRLNPKVKNPHSTAQGLIQFTNASAQALGYLTSAKLVEKNPTRESQMLGPVVKYFRDLWKVKPNNFEDMVAVLFYPKYRNTPTKRLPDSIINVNPGIDSIATYAKKIRANYERWKGTGRTEPAYTQPKPKPTPCPHCGGSGILGGKKVEK